MTSTPSTLRFRSAPHLARTKLACALVFTLLVGVCSYSATYRALAFAFEIPPAPVVAPTTVHSGPPTATVPPSAPVTAPSSRASPLAP